ncbi:MAG: 4-hydroxythreonine-4-phosphate dehydrogenase PdxA [Gammaproteobacteria bacterium]
MKHTPRIALTTGEPAGIGPDLCLSPALKKFAAEIVCIGDIDVINDRARQLQCAPLSNTYQQDHSPLAGNICVQHIPCIKPVTPGTLERQNSAFVLQTLDRAIAGCLSGEFDAMVTGPVHKGIINEAGIPFTGHTEYLAEKSHTDRVVMVLATTGLRVALATTHLPLAAVSAAITKDELSTTLKTLHTDLARYTGKSAPHILVAGLNPHAGEDGHLGREEIEIIEPVLDSLRQQGMSLEGPLPADTLFTPPYLRRADAILAMYHDQGLPVLKHLGFGNAVNMTYGLPFIRTSVDHGTALTLAGTGKANDNSLQTAIRYALDMLEHR